MIIGGLTKRPGQSIMHLTLGTARRVCTHPRQFSTPFRFPLKQGDFNEFPQESI
jgi:hypothetical protein